MSFLLITLFSPFPLVAPLPSSLITPSLITQVALHIPTLPGLKDVHVDSFEFKLGSCRRSLPSLAIHYFVLVLDAFTTATPPPSLSLSQKWPLP